MIEVSCFGLMTYFNGSLIMENVLKPFHSNIICYLNNVSHTVYHFYQKDTLLLLVEYQERNMISCSLCQTK